ncbi:MAG: type VI secretion system tube protein Hcp [Thermoanaerobaculaceae bacterium]|nr:type VI secretion system tube protein Hcp [Thermoanaerobaculaceae bacterium]TAM56439.1 MAG: type VI secretion system tube protein Hcp [Acidobacteriota bacterium]
MKRVAGLAVAVLAAGLVGAGTAPAAGGLFLKIDGIDGESTQADHRSEIQFLSVTWGVSRPTVGARAARSIRTPLNSFTIVKRLDKSSPKLMQACATGRHILTVTLSMGTLKYEFHDVVISSCRNGGATETVAFSYGSKVQIPVTTSPAPNPAIVWRH